MISVHIFKMKNYATFYVVSTPEAIHDLCSFAENHQVRGDLSADALSKRILFHNAYCCVIPETLIGRISVMPFTRTLKMNDHLIDIDAYFEAFILADPAEAASLLSVPISELIEIAKDSDWGLIFDVDRNEVVEELRKIKHG